MPTYGAVLSQSHGGLYVSEADLQVVKVKNPQQNQN